MLSCGLNDRGQTLLGEVQEKVSELREIDSLDALEVSKISAGSRFVLILANNGTLKGAGECIHGQLGIEKNDFFVELRNIPFPHKVLSIATSSCASIVLTEEGVFGCGDDPVVNNSNRFLKIAAFADKKITQIAAGYSHYFVMDDHGDIFGWGTHADGELGIGKPEELISEGDNLIVPAKVVFNVKDEKLKTIHAGKNFTIFSSHSGKLYSCGIGSSGALGLLTKVNYAKPTLIKLLDKFAAVQVVCGGKYSACLTG